MTIAKSGMMSSLRNAYGTMLGSGDFTLSSELFHQRTVRCICNTFVIYNIMLIRVFIAHNVKIIRRRD